MKTWFTSDTHFGHENIIEYSKRPFKSLQEMNKTIIRNWNQRVKPEDIVIFLGDFCFRNTMGGKVGEGVSYKADYYIKQLNGNIIFIKGNHDSHNSLNTKIQSLVLDIGGYEIFCTHKPDEGNNNYYINLVGHVHEHWKHKFVMGTNLINVSVDVWNFRPVSIDEILKLIQQRKT